MASNSNNTDLDINELKAQAEFKFKEDDVVMSSNGYAFPARNKVNPLYIWKENWVGRVTRCTRSGTSSLSVKYLVHVQRLEDDGTEAEEPVYILDADYVKKVD